MSTRTLLLLLWLSAILVHGALAEEEAEKVFRLVSPSVVVIENDEGHGTGIIVHESGVILTNAHVVVSPLAFRVRVFPSRGDAVEFRRVSLVGVHPTYDLALLRVDPKEHAVPLPPATIVAAPGNTGQRQFVIGNPSAGGVTLAHTIVEGMIGAADRRIDGLGYYQLSAAVNPGMSGGPVCNRDGMVLGVATFKYADAEGIAFAIPIHDLDLRTFAALAERPRRPERSRKLLDLANGRIREAVGLKAEDERRMPLLAFAVMLYRQALLEDSTNPGIYRDIGTLLYDLGESKRSVAYLLRSLDLGPWDDERGMNYYALGRALSKEGRDRESLAVLQEGISKHPKGSGRIWEDLAIRRFNDKSYAEAGFDAMAALACGDCRAEVLRPLIEDVRSRLSPQEGEKLDVREKALASELDGISASAEQARKAGARFLDPDVEKLLSAWEGLQRFESTAALDESVALTRGEPSAGKESDAEAAAWIKGRLSLAKNFLNAGMKEKAREILEEVIEKYPDRPESKDARKLLEQSRK